MLIKIPGKEIVRWSNQVAVYLIPGANPPLWQIFCLQIGSWFSRLAEEEWLTYAATACPKNGIYISETEHRTL